MEPVTSGSTFLWSAPYLLVIPLYVVLSPLCIISSSLFDAALGITFDLDKQTTILILILLVTLGISAFSVFQLIKDRSRDGCFKAFRLNHWLGFTVFVGVVLGLV